ncbi:MAG: hypothetical protein DMG49_13405 [Acidobacteria bacterium]|nr:MAG: hypothetical protein DMG49_13405 [Acidobacteriota bacterium]
MTVSLSWHDSSVLPDQSAQTETSLELLAEKMRHAQSTRAQIIVTTNPDCLLQLRVGVQIHYTNQQVLHVVELLDRSMRP